MNKTEVLEWLEEKGTQRVIDDMSKRYGIATRLRVLGVGMGTMQSLAKPLRKQMDAESRHRLAAELWDAGVYEAQMTAVLIDEPSLITKKQMNDWAASFDNWGIVDTACFCLFDRTPIAWERIVPWTTSPKEFIRRAGYVLMACLAGHDRDASDEQFLQLLPVIEEGAHDNRNFVKKGVSWALRRIGTRTPTLRAAALDVANRLAAADPSDGARRWVGKEALREFAATKSRETSTREGRKGKEDIRGDEENPGKEDRKEDHEEVTP